MITFKQWREALGGVGEPSSQPINPNEPSRTPKSTNAMTVPPIDLRMRMQKLKMNKPMQ